MAEKRYPCDSFPHLIHGGDYNPEQWLHDKSVWDEDMRLMKLAHTNEMTLGIFSWAKLEPREGEYDFSFLDEIIEKIGRRKGILVNMGGMGRVRLEFVVPARAVWSATALSS